jgi:hypothetical protein
MSFLKRFLMVSSVVMALGVAFGLNVYAGQGRAHAVEERVNVLIGFNQIPTAAEEALVHAAGGRVKYRYHLVPAIAASLPSSAIDALRRNPRVNRIEPDIEIHAIDFELDNAWGVKHIGSGTVHDRGNKGAGVNVAVIDSGADYTHPDLDGNYMGGYDFVNGDHDPMDDAGHGTHVSGTVLAEDDGVGVVGVAPQARLYALKVLNASGSGSFSNVIAALQWAVDNNIEVTNNSYGSSQNPGGIVQDAFDNSAAAGIIHIAAAGNSGNPKGKGNSVEWPGRYDSVVAVAATDSSDQRASFSSSGDQVEIAAPGVGINSTRLGGGYTLNSGTSMASPHVAGVAALVIASGITDQDGDGLIHNEVRQQLTLTADDLGDPGRDTLYGFGLVNADLAAAPSGPVNASPEVNITFPANNALFASGVSVPFSGIALDNEDGDLTADLVWDSNQDGLLGVGGSLWVALSDNVHTITSSVTDLDGATGTDTITVTVGTPPPTPGLVVTVTTDKPSYVHREQVLITVTVTDGSNAVQAVSVGITINTTSGRTLGGSDLTNSSGQALFEYKVNSKRDGTGPFNIHSDASKVGFEDGMGSTTFDVL